MPIPHPSIIIIIIMMAFMTEGKKECHRPTALHEKEERKKEERKRKKEKKKEGTINNAKSYEPFITSLDS